MSGCLATEWQGSDSGVSLYSYIKLPSCIHSQTFNPNNLGTDLSDEC